MIDIHSHLLPGIDDGSQSQQQSLAVLRAFVDAGITGVVLTPHVTAGEMAQEPDRAVARRAKAYDPLRRVRLAAPQLHLGFEIMLDQPLSAVSIGDKRFALAESRYYLVEFPYSVVAEYARSFLGKMTRVGAVPVVAHPERYAACSPETVRGWRDAGARIQVDSTSLTKPTRRGYRARQLLVHGLADVIAADNHGNNRLLSTGVQYLRARGAGEAVELLSSVNPEAIVNDEELTPVPPLNLRERMSDRWRRLMGE